MLHHPAQRHLHQKVGGAADPNRVEAWRTELTAAEIAGAAAMPAVDGLSLWDRLQGGGAAPEETFSEFYTAGTGEPPSRMVRRGDWKLYHYHGDAAPVLYNLAEDPGELRDLGGDPAHAEVRDGLMRALYRDWDPERVLRRSGELERDMKLLSAWGRKVQPPHEDRLPVPDAEAVVRR